MTSGINSFNLSPLDRLEEQSRKLASNLDVGANTGRLQDVQKRPPPLLSADTRGPDTTNVTNKENEVGGSQRQDTDGILASPVQIEKLSIRDDGSDDEDDDGGGGLMSSRASIASFATTGGGILDSFRLSSLPQEVYAGGSLDSDASSSYRVSMAPSIVHTSRGGTVRSSLAPSTMASQFQNLRTSVYNTRHVSGPAAQYRPASSVYPNDETSSLYSRKSYSELRSPKSPKSPVDSRKKNQYFFPEPSDVRTRYQTSQQHRHSDIPISSHSVPTTPGSHSSAQLLMPPTLRRNPASADPSLSPSLSDASSASDKRFNEMTNEEHVSVGIEMHEKGQVREASYHWQYAAQHGDLTGMLLYGLALRHGWGVRQNATEAVKWLQKAMEISMQLYNIESSPDSQSNTNTTTTKTTTTTTNKEDRDSKVRQSTLSLMQGETISKTKRAQIALALYELGMSYLHSWGTEKNETLALRSFEMAGNLGDTDALCEAAAMYMHSGPGRKKDMFMAASLYRRAGDLGASMVGNSWIYKSKYMEDKKKKKK